MLKSCGATTAPAHCTIYYYKYNNYYVIIIIIIIIITIFIIIILRHDEWHWHRQKAATLYNQENDKYSH